MGRQELSAENAKKTPKLKKLKCKLLKFLNRYDLYRVIPWESWRPEDSNNVVVFEFWRFQTIVIARQSLVKIEEKIQGREGVKKINWQSLEDTQVGYTSHQLVLTLFSIQEIKRGHIKSKLSEEDVWDHVF